MPNAEPTFSRVYTRATEPDGRVWYYGECPELPGCLVYSREETDVPGLLSEAIRVMRSPIPTDTVLDDADHA